MVFVLLLSLSLARSYVWSSQEIMVKIGDGDMVVNEYLIIFDYILN